jgi:hypothetical protein
MRLAVRKYPSIIQMNRSAGFIDVDDDTETTPPK